MKCIWDAGRDMSLVETMAALKEKYQKEWKRQTVSTFLLHLIQKGFLTSYRVGRVFYYHQEIDLDAYKKQQTIEFVDFWYSGSIQALFASLKGSKCLPQGEISELKKLLEAM